MYKADEGPRLIKISSHKEEQKAIVAILPVKAFIKHNNEETTVLVCSHTEQRNRLEPRNRPHIQELICRKGSELRF